jgi:DNA mismatch repair protein MutL
MIKRLSDDLVNQIAAGEVVERPAHLVKELVENSIDAKATEIEVLISEGGRYIEIRDNGSGIPKKDLALAVERHTTSKINKIDDLWNIHSFGFRGEALASAASVSVMQISSKPESQDEGARVKIEFGAIGETQKSAMDNGTTVLIEKLFENVPARLKFLKSASAEVTQIKNTLKALGLAHPQVGFRIKVDEKLVYYWPATDNLIERVQVVTEQFEIFETTAEVSGFKARVFACSPNVTFSQNKKIWTFVKNRWVQDRGMQTAVIEAYRSLLMHGEYPIAVVFLDCPTSELDVNIHPTKSQVKFRDPSLAFRSVHRATRDLLEKAPWLKALLSPATDSSANQSLSAPSFGYTENQSVDGMMPLEFSSPEFLKTQFKSPQFKSSPSSSGYKFQHASTVHNEASTAARPATGLTNQADSWMSNQPTPTASTWSSLHLIGQAHLTYIVTQNGKGLLFIDQHAAHERVLFERLQKDFKEQRIEVQSYLIPFVVDLNESELEKLTPYFNKIEQDMGISLDQVGPESVAVRSAPALINEDALGPVIQKIATEISEQGESFAFDKLLNDIFATMACHSAIRAGRALSLEEMQQLLAQMEEFPMSSFCPHGRPVYVEYPFSQLERDFGRTV